MKICFNDEAGICSNIFFFLRAYIHCKVNKINLDFDSSKWIFGFEKGWEDYFEKVDLKFESSNPDIPIQNYKLKDFVIAIEETYMKYNTLLTDYIKIKKDSISLPEKYGAIFIRRGDKMINESDYIKTEKYVDLLFKSMPDCNTIFVQTDDYRAVDEVKNCVNNPNIKIVSICPTDYIGVVVTRQYIDKYARNEYRPNNKTYFENINFKGIKPVSEMSGEEKKEHTLLTLAGIDISINSQCCVLDYQSNISRFIKLAGKNKILSVNNEQINLETIHFPAYFFDDFVSF